MAENKNKMLENLSERLSIYDPKIIKKAKWFLETLQAKSAQINLNDSARVVICLDLAATHEGNTLDKEFALKLSGLKKNVYQNNLRMVEKLLELDKPLTVADLCVKLSCTVIRDVAENLLEKYREENVGRDFTHPQYVAAAVYVACKIKRIKIEKSQCVSMSRLKSVQWKEIEAEFMKFATSMNLISDKNTKKLKNVEKSLNELDISEAHFAEEKMEEDACEVEDYEVWKERILFEARKALKHF